MIKYLNHSLFYKVTKNKKGYVFLLFNPLTFSTFLQTSNILHILKYLTQFMV